MIKEKRKLHDERIPLRRYVVTHYIKRELLIVILFVFVFISSSIYIVDSIKQTVLKNLPNRVLSTFSIINKKSGLLARVYENDFLYALYRVENALFFGQDVTNLLNLIYKERFSKDFVRLDYYLIDNSGIVYKTSYEPDLGLNLSQFQEFWKRLKDNLRRQEYYFQIHATESATGFRRIYVYKTTQNGDILEIGGIINPKIYEEDLMTLKKLSVFVEQVSVLFGDRILSNVFDYPPKERIHGYKRLYKSEHWFEVKDNDEVFKIYVRTNFYRLFLIVEMAIVPSVVLIISTLLYLRSFTKKLGNEIEKVEEAINEYGNSGNFNNEYSSFILEVDDTLKTFVNLSEVISANIQEITATNEELEASYKEIEELSKEIQDAFYDFSFKLAYIVEGFEEGTGKHLTRVKTIVERIAEKIIDDAKLREEIAYYSVLHDIGKIFIPQEILNKPGALSPEEWEEMKKHTIYAQKVLSHPRFKTALNIAMYHHENFDGTGYPYGLRGEEIPIEARIVKIADVYDALTSERPYKKAFTKEQALKIMFEGDGRVNPQHFDPKILEVFKEIVDEL